MDISLPKENRTFQITQTPDPTTTILITGGAGYVGSLLTNELLKKGYKVKVLDNLLYNQSAFLFLLTNKDLKFIKGDIRKREDVKKALKGVDVILHLAAIVGMPACRADPSLAETTNVGGTKIINELRSKDQFLIYASTGSVYGTATELCTEETLPSPTSIYGKTKLEAEKIVMSKENSVVLRFATAFGFSIQPRFGYMIINDFVQDVVFNKLLVVYDKDFKRAFIHVRDMVRSYLFTIENFEKMRGQVFNVGSEKLNYTKAELALKIKEKLPYELIFTERPDDDKRNYAISYKKIRDLGFETEIGIDEGINELIKGFKVLAHIKARGK